MIPYKDKSTFLPVECSYANTTKYQEYLLSTEDSCLMGSSMGIYFIATRQKKGLIYTVDFPYKRMKATPKYLRNVLNFAFKNIPALDIVDGWYKGEGYTDFFKDGESLNIDLYKQNNSIQQDYLDVIARQFPEFVHTMKRYYFDPVFSTIYAVYKAMMPCDSNYLLLCNDTLPTLVYKTNSQLYQEILEKYKDKKLKSLGDFL